MCGRYLSVSESIKAISSCMVFLSLPISSRPALSSRLIVAINSMIWAFLEFKFAVGSSRRSGLVLKTNARQCDPLLFST